MPHVTLRVSNEEHGVSHEIELACDRSGLRMERKPRPGLIMAFRTHDLEDVGELVIPTDDGERVSFEIELVGQPFGDASADAMLELFDQVRTFMTRGRIVPLRAELEFSQEVVHHDPHPIAGGSTSVETETTTIQLDWSLIDAIERSGTDEDEREGGTYRGVWRLRLVTGGIDDGLVEEVGAIDVADLVAHGTAIEPYLNVTAEDRGAGELTAVNTRTGEVKILPVRDADRFGLGGAWALHRLTTTTAELEVEVEGAEDG